MSTHPTSSWQDLTQPTSIRVTDILPPASTTTDLSSSTDQQRRRRLARQDQQHGPVRIGEFIISRQDLYELGARLNGQEISSADAIPLEPDQTFIDALQVDPAKVEGRLQSAQHSDSSGGLLFELSVLRSTNAQPLLAGSSPDLSASMQQLNKLLASAQQLSLSNPSLPDNLPSWADKAKSSGMTSMGVGLQGYGIYSGIMGIAQALKQGDLEEAGLNAGGIGAEVGSLFVERGLENVGRRMMLNGDKVLTGFKATSAGKLLARGAGLLASVLTLPFDIYTAIKAFNDAANATGKEAQDHYFNAALSLTSAGLSIALGVAALAGFSAAGPLGIAAAAVLILGSRIYSAARQVDDIDDYISLSTHERWRSGWFAFTGQSLDEGVLDRYQIARTDAAYGKQLRDTANSWLEGERKDIIEAVVLGNYHIELQPVKHWKHQWDEDTGESPYTDAKESVVKETDDSFDASEGISHIPGAITGSPAENKGIIWQLGGGNDTVTGIKNKPNYFSFSTGKKNLTGGEKNDQFTLQVTGDGGPGQPGSRLVGGDGNDTLILLGNVSRDAPLPGFNIDLQGATLNPRNADNDAATALESIENVETLAGVSNHVTGTSLANRIVLHGIRDVANAGAGDDEITIKGFNNQVDGGAGIDRYFIADETGATTLIEDGKDASVIELGWTLERIQSWRIEGTSLVLVALRGIDAELPETTVTIRGVYQQVAEKRHLLNDKLVFITQDKYSLKPDLPQTLDGDGTLSVNVIILSIGEPREPAQLLIGGEHPASSAPQHSYFIFRNLPSTVLDVRHQSDSSLSTLYLDYDSQQIEAVEANYKVSSTRTGSFDYLRYRDVNLTLRFTDQKCLTFKNIARSDRFPGSNVAGSLMASGLVLNQRFLLVMRDGASYRVQPPHYSYFDDHLEPGHKTVQTRQSLVKRNGHYLMSPPATHSATVLKPQDQLIKIEHATQVGVYVLQGQAATYEIYPAVDTILRLSTSANSIGTSTWHIHTQHLSNPISREHITLSDSQLSIGQIIVLLPQGQSDSAALETVRVFTSSGHRYDVEQEFALLYLAELNAQAYSSVDAIRADITRQQRDNPPLADLVLIRHLRVRNDMSKSVYFDNVAQDWTLEGDWSRKLHNEDMDITQRPVGESD